MDKKDVYGTTSSPGDISDQTRQVLLEKLLAGMRQATHEQDKEQVRALYKEVLKVDPHHNAAIRWLAWNTSDPFEAVGYLEKLVELNPSDSRARQLLEVGRQRCGELDELIAHSSLMNYWSEAEQIHTERIRQGVDRRDNPVLPLGQLLLKKGYITSQQLETGLTLQELFDKIEGHHPLGEILVEAGYLSQGQLAAVLSEQQTDFETQFY